MNRREFVKSVAAMPCVAVAGAVAVAPAIHTTGYIQSTLAEAYRAVPKKVSVYSRFKPLGASDEDAVMRLENGRMEKFWHLYSTEWPRA